MCFRYALTVSHEELLDQFEVDTYPDEYPTGYNLSPFHFLPVICLDRGKKRALHVQWWGFIPTWSEPNHKLMRVNARAETLANKPSFHHAYRRRRCIVPASGFFEWPKESFSQQPTYIQPVAENVLGLGGLWERWDSPEGETMETFTIVTVEANERVLPISHRMPLVLDKENYQSWLDPDTPIRVVTQLIRPCPSEKLLAYPVSRAVNQPENNTPEVIKPLKIAVD